jgi:hypothetical protein
MDASEFTAAMSELNPLRLRGVKAARARMNEARAMCDAAADASMFEQAKVTRRYEDSEAVASEWGLVSIAAKLEREAKAFRTRQAA